MGPDFSKSTIDTLAKRASFLCSNPNHRAKTVGPNDNPNKVTLIGEAAHIFGAREGSKRYNPNMTDAARRSISNGIWLCRNCHKIIDSDEEKFSSVILFKWRELHEEFVFSELLDQVSKVEFEERKSTLIEFEQFSPQVKRIILDKPPGWEYMLTAELMRELNSPLFKKMDDLKKGLYVRPLELVGPEIVFQWIDVKLNSIQSFMEPFCSLMNRLTESWGEPGEEGSELEILRYCLLTRDLLEQAISLEEEIYFCCFPQGCEKVPILLRDLLGSQIVKLHEVPYYLDEVLELISDSNVNGQIIEPIVVKKEIKLEIPKSWSKIFNKELKSTAKKIGVNIATEDPDYKDILAWVVILCLIVSYFI